MSTPLLSSFFIHFTFLLFMSDDNHPPLSRIVVQLQNYALRVAAIKLHWFLFPITYPEKHEEAATQQKQITRARRMVG